MPIQGFDPEEFTRNLSKEAITYLPEDLTEEQRRYVINTLSRFCVMAGGALNDDTSISLNSEQANIITQFIGEWTFHKSVDLIRSGVPQDCWDNVLQAVAFSVFEAAKHTQVNNFEINDTLKVVEEAVRSSFEKAIAELSQAGKLDQPVDAILSQSNIDSMAQADVEMNKTKEEEDRMLKLASIAILLKKLPRSKAEVILNNFDEDTINQLREYFSIPDLEKKINPELATSFLNNFKDKFIKSKRAEIQSLERLSILIKGTSKSDLNELFENERPLFVSLINELANKKDLSNPRHFVSSNLSDVVYNYIKARVGDE